MVVIHIIHSHSIINMKLLFRVLGSAPPTLGIRCKCEACLSPAVSTTFIFFVDVYSFYVVVVSVTVTIVVVVVSF